MAQPGAQLTRGDILITSLEPDAPVFLRVLPIGQGSRTRKVPGNSIVKAISGVYLAISRCYLSYTAVSRCEDSEEYIGFVQLTLDYYLGVSLMRLPNDVIQLST